MSVIMTLQGPPMRRAPSLLGRLLGMGDAYMQHPQASTMSNTTGTVAPGGMSPVHTTTLGPRGRNLTSLFGLKASTPTLSTLADVSFLDTIKANPIPLLLGIAAGIWAAKKYGGAK